MNVFEQAWFLPFVLLYALFLFSFCSEEQKVNEKGLMRKTKSEMRVK